MGIKENRELTRLELQRMDILKRRRKIKRVKTPLSVFRYERQYREILRDVLKQCRAATIEALELYGVQAIQEYKKEYSVDSFNLVISADAWTTAIKELTEKLNLDFTTAAAGGAVAASEIFSKLDRANFKEWRAAQEKVLGITVTTPETWKTDLMQSYRDINTGLITRLTDDTRKKIDQEIIDSITSGDTYNTLKKKIAGSGIDSGVFKSVEYRTELIARDQIGKINGELTRQRQTDIGVESYIWRTAADERVRGTPGGKYPNAKPSHFNREGKVFLWTKPPEGGHPGEAIQCRCYAEANFGDLFEQDELIQTEKPTTKTAQRPGQKPKEGETVYTESISEPLKKIVPPDYNPIRATQTETENILNQIIATPDNNQRNRLQGEFSVNYMLSKSTDPETLAIYQKNYGKIWDGIDPLEYKEIILQTQSMYKRFPALINNQHGLGTKKEMFPIARARITEKATRLVDKANIRDTKPEFYELMRYSKQESITLARLAREKEIKRIAKKAGINKIIIKKRVIASSWSKGTAMDVGDVFVSGVGRVDLSPKMIGVYYNHNFTAKNFKARTAEKLAIRGYHVPVNKVGFWGATTNHELGHQVSDLITGNKKKEMETGVFDIIKSESQKTGKRPGELISKYVEDHGDSPAKYHLINESIAESFSEFYGNTNPSNISARIVEYVTSFLK